MAGDEEAVISLVPEGGEHVVVGDRKIISPGMTLEILSTRLIETTVWRLRGLNDPFWRLYIPASGRALIATANEQVMVEAELSVGNAYLIPPHTTIYSDVEEPFAKWYVHFSLGQRGDRAVPGLYPVTYTAGMKRSLKQLTNLEDTNYPWSAMKLVGEALEQLPVSVWSHRNVDARVEAAMDFMYENLNQKLSSEDIASAARVSVRNLNHLFKQHLGVAPKNVLLEFRLSYACRLLRHSDKSIEEIAEECGFPNRYYFSRMMKQVRSISPAAYRKAG